MPGAHFTDAAHTVDTEFVVRVAGAPAAVSVTGAWDGWAKCTPMTPDPRPARAPAQARRRGAAQTWRARVAVPTGRVAFKFRAGDDWLVSDAYECEANGLGGSNNWRYVTSPKPKHDVDVEVGVEVGSHPVRGLSNAVAVVRARAVDEDADADAGTDGSAVTADAASESDGKDDDDDTSTDRTSGHGGEHTVSSLTDVTDGGMSGGLDDGMPETGNMDGEKDAEKDAEKQTRELNSAAFAESAQETGNTTTAVKTEFKAAGMTTVPTGVMVNAQKAAAQRVAAKRAAAVRKFGPKSDKTRTQFVAQDNGNDTGVPKYVVKEDGGCVIC